MSGATMKPAKGPELCARCGIEPAAFRVERGGRVWCGWFCARAEGEVDGAAVAVHSARERIVQHVTRKEKRLD
jgi:hypothetical protein